MDALMKNPHLQIPWNKEFASSEKCSGIYFKHRRNPIEITLWSDLGPSSSDISLYLEQWCQSCLPTGMDPGQGSSWVGSGSGSGSLANSNVGANDSGLRSTQPFVRVLPPVSCIPNKAPHLGMWQQPLPWISGTFRSSIGWVKCHHRPCLAHRLYLPLT